MLLLGRLANEHIGCTAVAAVHPICSLITIRNHY